MAIAVAASVLVACSSSGGPAEDGVTEVEVQALDTFAFAPTGVHVDAGETVRFRLVNTGDSPHEFVLGSEEVQLAHAEAAASGGHHGAHDVEGQLAAVELPPGATEEVEVTFEEPGELIYGCHVAGHYAAGMRGTVTVA